jgi:hypothetical protein
MPHLRDASPITSRRTSPAGAALRWFPLEPPEADVPPAPSAAPAHLGPAPERRPFTVAPDAAILDAKRAVDRIEAERPAA